MIKAVVFDLDHTLFDRYGTFTKMFHQASPDQVPFAPSLTPNQMTAIFTALDRLYIYDEGFAKFPKYLKALGVARSDLSDDDFFNQYVAPLFSKVAVPFSFTIPMLKQLHEMGLITGLITNGAHALQSRKLDLLGLEPYLDITVISGDTGYHKPDKRVFQAFFDKVPAIAPNEMLYVGDNPLNDVEGSRNAGMIPVWIKTTAVWPFPNLKHCEYELDSVESIPSLVSRLNAQAIVP